MKNFLSKLIPQKINTRSTTETVDIIQKIIYTELLKPLGFKKYGRTFNRTVDEDIVQVIHLQNGMTDLLRMRRRNSL